MATKKKTEEPDYPVNPQFSDVFNARMAMLNEGHTVQEHLALQDNELVRAAACLMLTAGEFETLPHMVDWPFGNYPLAPATRRENLVQAAAVLLAEIERIDCSVE